MELHRETQESIEAARHYQQELQCRMGELQRAINQVEESGRRTSAELMVHFSELERELTARLRERRDALLSQVDTLRHRGQQPLLECQRLLQASISTTEELLWEGEKALQTDPENRNQALLDFSKKSLQMQLHSLPEVPLLVDVPCLSAQLDPSLLRVLSGRVAEHGSLATHAPVQISELRARPGAVLVRWSELEDATASVQYHLQFCRGRATLDGDEGSGGPAPTFTDAYTGPEREFALAPVDAGVHVTFRVCARHGPKVAWSPWSIPLMGRTHLHPYEWTQGNDGFSLSSRRNMALRTCAADASPVLYTREASLTCGETATFRIEAVGATDQRDGVGLSVGSPSDLDSLQRDGAICIATNGAVFVNGREMINQLPPLTTGSAVTFDSERVAPCKLRVAIGCGRREVLVDWPLGQPAPSLHLACRFSTPGWKVLAY
ncbi:cytokine receptor-like factor 3 isoform X1 [Lampetra fluviatilis]